MTNIVSIIFRWVHLSEWVDQYIYLIIEDDTPSKEQCRNGRNISIIVVAGESNKFKDKCKKQAEAELGQAQPELGLEAGT